MDFQKLVANRLESAREDIAAFAAKLAADPAHAMSWSTSAFEAAARVAVYSEIAAALVDRGIAPAAIVAEATKRAVRVARYPARSTSVPSNLMEQATGEVWASIIETFSQE